MAKDGNSTERTQETCLQQIPQHVPMLAAQDMGDILQTEEEPRIQETGLKSPNTNALILMPGPVRQLIEDLEDTSQQTALFVSQARLGPTSGYALGQWCN